LPYKSKYVLRKLQKLGFEIIRQSGSHVILRHPDGRQTYVAMHAKELATGTFMSILKQAEISFDEFRNIK
jgi:predicted RNA binding protein YcfA (HicA-like mRNA interferase family)